MTLGTTGPAAFLKVEEASSAVVITREFARTIEAADEASRNDAFNSTMHSITTIADDFMVKHMLSSANSRCKSSYGPAVSLFQWRCLLYMHHIIALPSDPPVTLIYIPCQAAEQKELHAVRTEHSTEPSYCLA